MSLTRKLLKGMGLTDEQQDTIMEAHIDTVNGLKSDVERYKSDAEKLPSVREELNALKAKGDDGWKDKYDTLKKEFEQHKKDQTAKETHEAKEKAVRALMKEVGISEKRLDSVLKVYDIDSVELEENGAIKDANKLTESIKKDWSDFIVTTDTQGASIATPPANNGTAKLTKADIYKKDDKGRYVMSASERQKALAENPEIMK